MQKSQELVVMVRAVTLSGNLILGYKKTARMIPPIKETAKKKRQLMKQVINENDKKRNHQLWNMTKKETVNFRYRILETGNFQIHEKMKTLLMKQTYLQIH